MVPHEKKFFPKHTLIVFLIALTATFFMAMSLYNNVSSSREARFTRNVTLAAQEIQDRIETYMAILRATKGFFVASGNQVTSSEFHVYVERLKLQEKYPGVQGIGFARAVQPEDKEAFEAQNAELSDGVYNIWPDSTHDILLPIIYLEPMDLRNRAAIGYDMYSEELRRRAIINARDTGAAAATDKVTLVQEIDQNVQPGFLIYMPLYDALHEDPTTVQTRRENFIGTIYSPFRVGDLFNKVLNERQPKVNFKLYEHEENAHETPVFQSENYVESDLRTFPNLKQIRHINIADKRWMVQFTPTPDFENRLNILLFYLTVFGGILVSILIAWLTSKQERISRKLAISEKRFRTVFNLQFQFMAILSPDGRIIDINELPLMVGGVKREDVISKVFWDCPWWDDLPEMRKDWPERLKHAAASNGPVVTIDKYRAADNSVRQADAAITAVRNTKGNIIYYIVQAHDITEREEVRKNLEHETHKLEQLNALMLTMTATLERDTLAKIAIKQATKLAQAAGGVFVYFTNQDMHLARYEVYGVDEDSFVLPAGLETRQSLDICFGEKPYLLAGHSGVLKNKKAILPFLNGNIGTVNSYLAIPVTARSGKIQGALFFADEKVDAFSERIAQLLEGVAAQLSISMENASLYNEITLNEERYRTLAEEAEAANIAKSEFLAKMSHEIRTPMNVITGLTDILVEGKMKGEKKDKIVTAMKTSTRQLMELINDVLDVTKIESRNFHLHEDKIYLRNVLQDVVALQSVEAEKKGIDLSLDYQSDPEEGYVVADELRVKQILINVISNAIKFTREGFVKVSCRTKYKPGQTVKVIIEVKDSGIGIKEDRLDQIFDKFTQADNSITREYGGSGLGLAICRDLVDHMGGHISVKSKFSKGSTFRIEFAFEKAEKETVEKAVSAKPKKKKTQKLKILLVDDHEANILVASHMLEGLGYKDIDVALTGQKALEMSADEDYDLILMDLQMPVTDGLTATREIRARESKENRKGSRIVGVTAHALADDRRKCLDAGMNDYLSKPFSVEDLKRILKESV